MNPMRFCAALLCASLLLAASSSHANGRFPLSQRLFQEQGNPDHLYLSATFGLLVSRDRGQNWYHVCESALTPELLESDILFEVMPDGAMLAALVRPLSVSTDCGCSWQPVLGMGKTDWVKDIAKAGQNSVVALMSDGIARSTDGGRTWSDVTPIAVTGGFQTFTLDAAPSDPMRLYVSITLNADPDAGIAQTTPALLVSDDGGESWTTRSMTGALSGDQPFIALVHPTNANIVYVRTDNWSANDETGLDDANDALFVTDDAGMTFREILRKGGKLFGFALSPDTETVLAGYGDPVQATRNVYPEDVGIYRASTSDHAFTLAINEPVSCLTWNGSGLYACFDELVGLSPDGSVPPMISGFTPVLAYADVRGPLACNGAVCLADWQEGRDDVAAVCERLDAECDVDPADNVITCSAPMGGAGGMGAAGAGAAAGAATSGGGASGSSSTTGMAGTMTNTGGASTGGAAATSGAQGDDGSDGGSSSSCGCRAPRAMSNHGAAVALALLALFGLRRRPRNRARRSG
jgi:MYXO-CTERM domain-containing protein